MLRTNTYLEGICPIYVKTKEENKVSKKFIPREEILARLKKVVETGRPILGAGCSAGLIAKCAEMGGADLIIAYSTGKSRLMGLPTTQIGDSNMVTLGMCDELQNVVKDTPIICGIEAVDPRKLDMRELITPFIQAGYSGIINFPTIAMSGELRIAERESVGLGYNRELEMVRVAREMNIFTIVYIFTPAEAIKMAEAGADCLIAHVRGTGGGLAGYKMKLTKEKAVAIVQEIIDAGRSVTSEIFCLAHGGPFESPKDTEYLYANTTVQGFVGASSIERIPIEKAVLETVKQFKSKSVNKGRR
jgi:predicted TIM-barrel enzyme